MLEIANYERDINTHYKHYSISCLQSLQSQNNLTGHKF